MKIDEVRIHPVTLPFSGDFSHSRKSGASAKNVIVELIAGEGELRGYGEGAPRSYVTGESQDSANESIKLFLETGSFPWDLLDISQIWDFVDSVPDGTKHNAALCALEMALLDAVGKEHGRSIIEFFSKDFQADSVYYGAILPLDEKSRITRLCRIIKRIGIHRVKLKMGKDLKKNKEIFEAAYEVFGNEYDLKIDVNGAWNRTTAFDHIHLMKNYGVKVVEQPMTPGDPDIVDFAEAMRSHGVKLMADESACSLSEVKGVVSEGQYNMINIRLSKCGGYRRSLRIIDYLRESKIPFQIGCQLGESGLLSAAGRILSLLCKDATYHDGSYDAFLLRENITETHVSFGPKGKAGPLGGTGLGVKVNSRNLELLSDQAGIVCFRRP